MVNLSAPCHPVIPCNPGSPTFGSACRFAVPAFSHPYLLSAHFFLLPLALRKHFVHT